MLTSKYYIVKTSKQMHHNINTGHQKHNFVLPFFTNKIKGSNVVRMLNIKWFSTLIT